MYDRAVVEKKNNYPFVLVHGFLGWGDSDLLSKVVPYFGMWNGNVPKLAKRLGFECYAPSLGPFSGTWDRTCELWAQLVGGTVDYGKVHSKKYNHSRYGRTYKALIPDWGKLDTEGKIKKINLIGHSFGGPTTRMFIDLLAKGSEEERAGTTEKDLSDLFKGGRQNWIHSETTLAASHNGVTLTEAVGEQGTNLLFKSICYLSAAVGKTPVMKVFDFRLDQFGITQPYHGQTKFSINKDGINAYSRNKFDNNGYEMTVNGAAELTSEFTTFENIYYFSYAGCCTKDSDGYQVPIMKSFILTKPLAFLEGRYTNSNPSKGAVIGKEWLPNDSMVNVVSALAPFNEKQEDFVSTDQCRPGIWYRMPVEKKDHHSYMGIGERRDVYAAFFYDIMKRVSNLPAVD